MEPRRARFTNRCLGAASAVILLAGVLSAPGVAVAAAGPKVVVEGTLYGWLPAPCSCTIPVYLSAQASGPAGALTGMGVTHSSTGPTYRFDLSGAVDESAVTLSGTIYKSTASFLIGTPVSLTADASTGEVTYNLGPLVAGVFAGQTLVFSGPGVVRIVPPQ